MASVPTVIDAGTGNCAISVNPAAAATVAAVGHRDRNRQSAIGNRHRHRQSMAFAGAGAGAGAGAVVADETTLARRIGSAPADWRQPPLGWGARRVRLSVAGRRGAAGPVLRSCQGKLSWVAVTLTLSR
ncbi:hypothetical protein F1559_000018 [Cyanidiococcus yangmingshanensis]|uniref:Uncharacterized protein n=1 Tax=Cyanidiococcus yangmingshanensis TaxID=2690220 RepID=A0A7J7IDH2_9RHOD|nr:hypothetical protein F1559_000018 [Cyanidiococcus yangmingshanensis]